MKRRDLEKHLKSHGCFVHREGANHSIWMNPATQRRSPINRHREIPIQTIRSMCTTLGIPNPPDKA